MVLGVPTNTRLGSSIKTFNAYTMFMMWCQQAWVEYIVPGRGRCSGRVPA